LLAEEGVRSPRWILLVLSIAACSDGELGLVDAGANQDTLCSSVACAAQPCAVGCVFEAAVGACPSRAPRTVSRATVSACAGFCQGYRYEPSQPSASGYCWRYDASLPGACQAPHCGWNSDCEIRASAFGPNEALICAPSMTCYDGTVPADLAVYCPDLSMPDDGGA